MYDFQPLSSNPLRPNRADIGNGMMIFISTNHFEIFSFKKHFLSGIKLIRVSKNFWFIL
jgi:hypothetical protein